MARKSIIMDEEVYERLTKAANDAGYPTGKGRSGRMIPFIVRLLDLNELAVERDWRKLWTLIDNSDTRTAAPRKRGKGAQS